MRQSRLPIGLIGGCVLLSLACTGGSPTPAAPPPGAGSGAPAPTASGVAAAPTTAPAPAAMDVVRVSHTQGLAGALQIAVARGYFQEQGIDLQREEFGNTAEAMVPLSTGELDAGSAAPNASFFNALARGIRLYLALAGFHLEPGAGGLPLMARLAADGPVARDVAGLRGKRIAHNQRGVVTEWALERMLAEVGLGLDDVEHVFMPFPEVLAAFGGGSVDGALMPEPFATFAEERGLALRLRESGDYLPGAQLAVLVFSERFARQRTDAARRWAVAYLRGARDYMDAVEHGRDREAILAILAQMSGLDVRIMEKMGYFPIRRDGRVNAEVLLAWLDWLVQHGYVPQKPDLTALLDPQFADYAEKTLDRTR